MLSRLEASQFLQAQKYMKENARPLDQRLYEFDFEEGSLEPVLNELEKFQNPDGGFGKGLEPDFRLASSSALASTVAFQILSKLNIDSNQGIVKKGIEYFLKTYNEKTHGWEKVPQEVENYPRAPWWNYQEPRNDWGNPNAEILGYLHEYHELVPSTLLQALTEYAIGYFNEMQEFEFHEILCFLRLADRLPEEHYNRIERKLVEAVKACVVTEPEKWDDYGMKPIQVVKSPDSHFYPLFEDAVNENLKYLIQHQNQDGSWSPNWSWFGQFEEVWPIAKTEWQGNITLNNLILFRNFDKIE